MSLGRRVVRFNRIVLNPRTRIVMNPVLGKVAPLPGFGVVAHSGCDRRLTAIGPSVLCDLLEPKRRRVAMGTSHRTGVPASVPCPLGRRCYWKDLLESRSCSSSGQAPRGSGILGAPTIPVDKSVLAQTLQVT